MGLVPCHIVQFLGNHNLCFESKIRKIGIRLSTPVFLNKSGIISDHL